MRQPTFLTITQQVAEHLRDGLCRGQWAGTIPGPRKLSEELGVNSKTIEDALRLLEEEGFLVGQGRGRPRRIAMPGNYNYKTTGMRIAILPYEPDDRKIDYQLDLQHQLREAGHSPFFAPKTLTELGMDVNRVAKLVNGTEADAWVVVAGSQPVLEWFAVQPFPAFGLFGRIASVPFACVGPKKIPALQTAVRRLVSLGHRRIVFMVREERRKPVPGLLEQAFLHELEAQGVPTGSYNLPDWEETRAGFRRLLDSLFLHTPPTALLIDTSWVTVATLQHFAALGIQSPRDVSLISMDPDPAFVWCDPVISHIAYDSRPWLRRIVHWAANVARGKDDRRTSFSLANFVEGGTIGPAKG